MSTLVSLQRLNDDAVSDIIVIITLVSTDTAAANLVSEMRRKKTTT